MIYYGGHSFSEIMNMTIRERDMLYQFLKDTKQKEEQNRPQQNSQPTPQNYRPRKR